MTGRCGNASDQSERARGRSAANECSRSIEAAANDVEPKVSAVDGRERERERKRERERERDEIRFILLTIANKDKGIKQTTICLPNKIYI